MLKISKINFPEINDRNFSRLALELNNKIDGYHRLNHAIPLENVEERARCYGILKDDYYWEHLKKAALFGIFPLYTTKNKRVGTIKDRTCFVSKAFTGFMTQQLSKFSTKR